MTHESREFSSLVAIVTPKRGKAQPENAALIVAAPDLYNVVEYVEAVFKSRSKDNETIPIETLRHILDISTKALKKTRGEQWNQD